MALIFRLHLWHEWLKLEIEYLVNIFAKISQRSKLKFDIYSQELAGKCVNCDLGVNVKSNQLSP